jgi:hypothetical protein
MSDEKVEQYESAIRFEKTSSEILLYLSSASPRTWYLMQRHQGERIHFIVVWFEVNILSHGQIVDILNFRL